MRQPDLFGSARPATPPVSELPDPAAIRVRLHAMLALVSEAGAMPWPPQRAGVQHILFHNMANWLPEAERDALRRDFAAEMDRLRATPAAPG